MTHLFDNLPRSVPARSRRLRSSPYLVLVAFAACVAPPSEMATKMPAPSETSRAIVAHRISLRDSAGRERIVLDADEGIMLLNGRGNPVCKLMVIPDDRYDTVSLSLGSDSSLQHLEGGSLWWPELVLGVVDGNSFLRSRSADGKWMLLRPGTGLEQYDKL